MHLCLRFAFEGHLHFDSKKQQELSWFSVVLVDQGPGSKKIQQLEVATGKDIAKSLLASVTGSKNADSIGAVGANPAAGQAATDTALDEVSSFVLGDPDRIDLTEWLASQLHVPARENPAVGGLCQRSRSTAYFSALKLGPDAFRRLASDCFEEVVRPEYVNFFAKCITLVHSSDGNIAAELDGVGLDTQRLQTASSYRSQCMVALLSKLTYDGDASSILLDWIESTCGSWINKAKRCSEFMFAVAQSDASLTTKETFVNSWLALVSASDMQSGQKAFIDSQQCQSTVAHTTVVEAAKPSDDVAAARSSFPSASEALPLPTPLRLAGSSSGIVEVKSTSPLVFPFEDLYQIPREALDTSNLSIPDTSHVDSMFLFNLKLSLASVLTAIFQGRHPEMRQVAASRNMVRGESKDPSKKPVLSVTYRAADELKQSAFLLPFIGEVTTSPSGSCFGPVLTIGNVHFWIKEIGKDFGSELPSSSWIVYNNQSVKNSAEQVQMSDETDNNKKSGKGKCAGRKGKGKKPKPAQGEIGPTPTRPIHTCQVALVDVSARLDQWGNLSVPVQPVPLSVAALEPNATDATAPDPIGAIAAEPGAEVGPEAREQPAAVEAGAKTGGKAGKPKVNTVKPPAAKKVQDTRKRQTVSSPVPGKRQRTLFERPSTTSPAASACASSTKRLRIRQKAPMPTTTEVTLHVPCLVWNAEKRLDISLDSTENAVVLTVHKDSKKYHTYEMWKGREVDGSKVPQAADALNNLWTDHTGQAHVKSVNNNTKGVSIKHPAVLNDTLLGDSTTPATGCHCVDARERHHKVTVTTCGWVVVRPVRTGWPATCHLCFCDEGWLLSGSWKATDCLNRNRDLLGKKWCEIEFV